MQVKYIIFILNFIVTTDTLTTETTGAAATTHGASLDSNSETHGMHANTALIHIIVFEK